jgi:hypothetical protein
MMGVTHTKQGCNCVTPRVLHIGRRISLPCVKNIQVIKSGRISWACSTYGENRHAYSVLVGKTEGRTQ